MPLLGSITMLPKTLNTLCTKLMALWSASNRHAVPPRSAPCPLRTADRMASVAAAWPDTTMASPPKIGARELRHCGPAGILPRHS
jgi:hypothetical protein